MVCPKCGENTDGRFCSSCGTRLEETKTDWSRVWFYVKDSVDVNTGFLLTLRLLLHAPGKNIRSYLEGNATVLSNPMKVLLLTGTIATFITARYWVAGLEETLDMIPWNIPELKGYFHYSTRYFSFFSLDALPIFALFSFWLFRSVGYNYVEHFLMNVYILGGQFIIVILFFPLSVFEIQINTAYGLINVAYNIWALYVALKGVKLGLLKATAAVIIPQLIMPVINYFVYRIAPDQLWTFLDLVFD